MKGLQTWSFIIYRAIISNPFVKKIWRPKWNQIEDIYYVFVAFDFWCIYNNTYFWRRLRMKVLNSQTSTAISFYRHLYIYIWVTWKWHEKTLSDEEEDRLAWREVVFSMDIHFDLHCTIYIYIRIQQLSLGPKHFRGVNSIIIKIKRNCYLQQYFPRINWNVTFDVLFFPFNKIQLCISHIPLYANSSSSFLPPFFS